MLRLPPLSTWIDATGTSIQEDEFFLTKVKYGALYLTPKRREPQSDTKALDDARKPGRRGEPVEQLSPKGIAVLLHILGEKEGKPQPLIASTTSDFLYVIKLIQDSPPGTQVTVIFQPTEGNVLFSALHKTVFKFEKTDSKVNAIHIDSTGNDTYFSSSEFWIKQAGITNIDFYRAKELEDPRGYPFYGLGFDSSTSEQSILERLQSESVTEYNKIPVLIQEGGNFWVYGFKKNREGVAERTLMKISNPELYNELFFPSYVKEMGYISKEIYADVAELGLYIKIKHPYSRQADLYQCGIFAIKDARQLQRDRDFLSKVTLFEDKDQELREQKGHPHFYETPPAYHKGIQSSSFARKAVERHPHTIVTKKGKTLQETYDKHNLEDGYIAHFSKKYHRQVEMFLAEHKDNPAFIRECVEKNDAGRMTLLKLVAIYGPQKNREVVSDSSTSTTAILNHGVGVTEREEKKLENKVTPNLGLEAEEPATSFSQENESLKDCDADKVSGVGQSQVFRKV